MATVKQQRAVKVVVSGGTPTEAMRQANYAPSVIRKPHVLTQSAGFKEELARYGLTNELITFSLVEDINSKPGKRYQELNLGAELLGMKKIDQRRMEGGDESLSSEEKDRILNILQVNIYESSDVAEK